MPNYGALPDKRIKDLIKAGFICDAKKENINPASLDLAISQEIYRVEGLFLPQAEEKIEDILENIGAKTHNLDQPLEKEVTYLAKLEETLSLPKSVYGYCNQKSSTGRNHILSRLMADSVPRYDSIPDGYKGKLWLSITPKSFPVKISQGTALNQLRFFNADTRLDELEIQIALKKYKLVWDPTKNKPLEYEDLKIKDNDGSLILTLDLSQEMVGYECRGSTKILDLSKKNFYEPDDFFEPIYKKNGRITLKEKCFYILSTQEAVLVPPEFSCEMLPTDHRSGEFRVHYAGFIDPGWGLKNGKGNKLTLEIMAFEDLIVRPKQAIAKIRFERMLCLPETHYSQKETSNYAAQNKAQLSKQFKS